jgi:hypothetical protein
MDCGGKMKTKINLLMWGKNSVPAAIEIEGSNELAYYVKRSGDLIVYTHAGKSFGINLKDVHAKTTRDN